MEMPQRDPHSRHQRAARNQSLFREVNEQIESLSHEASSTFHEFSCECADQGCDETVPLTHEEYEYVRRSPTHFFVRPGHVYPEVERVVETEGARYEVVEMFGEAGTAAVHFDPRSRQH